MEERKTLVVYFRNPKIIKQLENLGHVSYFHKKRRYAILYVNASELETIKTQLEKQRHVRKVEYSYPYFEAINEENTEVVK
ncbi:MAG: DUF2129 domain-containing protein [Candidatus Izemoplasmataceae bacterium]